MIALHLRQLNIYCRHMYFMKTGHELNCCVFISHECIFHLEIFPNKMSVYVRLRCINQSTIRREIPITIQQLDGTIVAIDLIKLIAFLAHLSSYVSL